MHKTLTSTLVITSMLFSPLLRATEAPSAPAQETYQEAYEETPDEESHGTPVGPGSDTATRAAKKRKWQNITLAVGAVLVAIAALVLVSKNTGHRNHHDKKK